MRKKETKERERKRWSQYSLSLHLSLYLSLSHFFSLSRIFENFSLLHVEAVSIGWLVARRFPTNTSNQFHSIGSIYKGKQSHLVYPENIPLLCYHITDDLLFCLFWIQLLCLRWIRNRLTCLVQLFRDTSPNEVNKFSQFYLSTNLCELFGFIPALLFVLE